MSNTPSVSLPEQVEAVIADWERFKGAANTYFAQLREISGIFGCRATLPDIDELSQSVIRTLCAQAATALAPAGVTLEINYSAVVSKFRCSDIDAFSPREVWSYLVEKFSPEDAYAQASEVFRRNLYELYERNRDNPVKWVGGMAVVSLSVYGESYSSSFYSYRSEEDARKVLAAFRTLVLWGGLDDDMTTAAFAGAVEKLTHNRSKESPGRISVRDLMLIVPFKSKIEFRLSAKLFEQLVLFQAQFSPAKDEE